VQRPGVERLGLGVATVEDGDSGLNEQPAGAARPGLGDGAAALRVAGAELARDQAEVGLDLMGVAEALGIVEGSDEGGGGDGPDGGHGAQSLDARIVGGELFDDLIGIGELAVAGQHDGEKRGDERAELARKGIAAIRSTEASAPPEGTR